MLVDPWVRKSPWRRGWQPTLIFLPVVSHGQRRLEGYSPYCHEESDMTEMTKHTHTHTHTHTLKGNPLPIENISKRRLEEKFGKIILFDLLNTFFKKVLHLK